MDRKFAIVAVVSRDPTIDLAELGRRRILFIPRYIDRRSLFTFIASFRTALLLRNILAYEAWKGRAGLLRFSLSFSFYHGGRIHKTFSVHISSQILGSVSIRGCCVRATSPTPVHGGVFRIHGRKGRNRKTGLKRALIPPIWGEPRPGK